MSSRVQKINIKSPINQKKYFRHVIYPSIKISERDIYIITRLGDRLDILAQSYYKDSQLWWVISNANPNILKRDSIYIKPGTQIRIPHNIERILNDFEALNK